MRKIFKLFVLLVLAITFSSTVSAKLYMGKITIKVGEVYFVEAVPTNGAYTASGYWQKSNSNFNFTAQGDYSCKIKGYTVGSGTLSYWGSVAISGTWSTEQWDLYWDVEVISNTTKVTSISLTPSTMAMEIGESQFCCCIGF